MLFVLIYIFALIGYFGVGIFTYVNFDNSEFNKLGFYFERALIKLFYIIAFLGIMSFNEILLISISATIIEIIIALCDTPFLYLSKKI